MLQTTAGGLRGAICLAPDRHIASSPLLLGSFQQTSRNEPQWGREKHESSAVSRGRHGVPQGKGEKRERKAEGTALYPTSAGRRSSSSFQLLLKAEIRPRISTMSWCNCCLPAWGQGTRTCLGHGGCCGQQQKGTQKPGLVQALEICSHRCRREAKVHPGPQTCPGCWFTHAINQAVRSHLSEASCKRLLTGLKNYPVCSDPSHRYAGR